MSHADNDDAVADKAASPMLYRGVTARTLAETMDNPVPSFWGTLQMAEHWATQALEDRPGEMPFVFAKPLSAFDEALLQPDLAMARDPVFEEDADHAGWKASGKDWRASLRCFESVRYDGPMGFEPGDLLSGGEGPA